MTGASLSLREIAKRAPYLVGLKRYIFRTVIERHSKTSFLQQLDPESRILDVGCGSNSPFFTKSMMERCHYTGLDVSDFNHSKPITADRYVLTTAERFAEELEKFTNEFDAVISTHNLEHCNERERALSAMLSAVKPGGRLYLSFPCEESVGFPNRSGTLNYYDDETHKGTPPDFYKVTEAIKAAGFEIDYAIRRNRPWLYWLQGLLIEGRSKRENRIYDSTWAYYGFESIVCARRPRAHETQPQRPAP